MSGTVKTIELGRKSTGFSLDAWYGVEYDITSPSTALTRIGRTDLIAAQPIYNRFRTRIKKNDRTTAYTLSRLNHNLKEDGSAADLSGAVGQVITDMPMHYVKLEADGNKVRIKQSEYPLPGFFQVKKYGFGKYLASVDGGGLLASVSGASPSGSLACNMTTSTGFGKRATNRGEGWSPVKWSAWNALQMCELVFTASWNSQAAISAGLTDGSAGDWAARGYGAVKANGNSNTLGDYTGSAAAGINNWYKGATTSAAANKCISTGRFASWSSSFIGMTIRNDITSATATIISKDSNDQITLSADIFPSAGQGFTIINSVYNTQSAVFAGIEDYYGQLWQWLPGLLVNYENYGLPEATAKAYICQLASKLADTLTSDFSFIGNLITASGYMVRPLFGYMLPALAGGSSATYMCDYCYASGSNGLRLLLVGGFVSDGSLAGSRCSVSYNDPGLAYATVGSRLGLEYNENEQEDK